MLPNFYGSQVLEDELNIIETSTAPIIRKLENGKRLITSERDHLARFISVLLQRTPKYKEETVDKIASEMMPEFFEEHNEQWLFNLIKQSVNDPGKREQIFEDVKVQLHDLREEYSKKPPDGLFLVSVLRESIFKQVLLQMDWGYFQPSEDIEFLTCDNPVAYNKKTGLKDKDAVIICPLSRNLFFSSDVAIYL